MLSLLLNKEAGVENLYGKLDKQKPQDEEAIYNLWACLGTLFL